MKKNILLSLSVALVLLITASLLFGSTYLDKYGPIGAKIFGLVTIKNTHLDSYTLKMQNKDGANRFSVDSSGSIYAVAGYAADTAAFTTSATRTAVYIKGALTTDRYFLTIRGQADALPVAGDLLRYWPKPDSLVVERAAGTTSGLQFSWMRLPY